MKRLAFAIAIALPSAALACGVCVEDKVAATYDHAVVTQAVTKRHIVVFAAIDGPAEGKVLAADAQRAASSVRGIDRGSVRSSAEPTALSFAIDSVAQAPDLALAAVEKAARTPGLKLTLLRTVR